MTNLYESIIHNQAVTHERLQWIIGLLVSGNAFGLILVCLVVWVLNVKIATRREVADMKELLVLVKGWVYSAKSNVSDAQATLKDVKQATAAIVHPNAEKHVIEAVEAVPEKTADRVIEKLAGDDIRKLLLPLAVLGGLTGAAFATSRADAEELRRANAATAMAWAGGTADSPR